MLCLSLLCLLDFSKAFDCIARYSSLEKFRTFGITDKWFRSCLTDGVQMRKVGHALSKPGSVCSGVPQGSILGPLFFILYVNDVPKEIRRLSTGNHTAGYADGTLMLNQCSKHIPSVMVQKTWNGTVAARQSVGGLGLKMNTGKIQIML